MNITLSEETINEITQLFKYEYLQFDNYFRYKSQVGPNIMGKIPEDMMSLLILNNLQVKKRE